MGVAGRLWVSEGTGPPKGLENDRNTGNIQFDKLIWEMRQTQVTGEGRGGEFQKELQKKNVAHDKKLLAGCQSTTHRLRDSLITPLAK